MAKHYLREELQWKMFKLNYSEPSDFYFGPLTECPIKVLVIRCFLLATAIGIVTYSKIYNLHAGAYSFWFIYLTRWGLTLVLLSTLFAVIVSSVALAAGDKVRYEDNISWYVKLYWVLYNCAIPLSILITIFYWTVLFEAGNNPIPRLVMNIAEHGVQTVVMLVLLFSSRQPSRLLHFYHPALFGITWTVFSIIYYFSGGVGVEGNPYIYPVVNWAKPAKTVVVVSMTAVALIVIHFLVVALTELRDWIADQFDDDDED